MKKLADLQPGARFIYGGVEWVKFADNGAGTLALAAEPVFERAFDEENCNDWRKSSLRRELNGPFLDALVAEGADRAAFLDWESDLTADDGMTDYGTATDKIALRSDALCREYRDLTPKVDKWCWNLTPWTCDPEYSYSVRSVTSSGTLSYRNAYYGNWGVRPLCNLKSEILVSVPGEEDGPEARNVHDGAVNDACEAVLETLHEFPAEVWGDALGAAVACLFQSKLDAEEIAEEENAAREG